MTKDQEDQLPQTSDASLSGGDAPDGATNTETAHIAQDEETLTAYKTLTPFTGPLPPLKPLKEYERAVPGSPKDRHELSLTTAQERLEAEGLQEEDDEYPGDDIVALRVPRKTVLGHMDVELRLSEIPRRRPRVAVGDEPEGDVE